MLSIIGGKLKGRRLLSPKDRNTRPTMGRTRQVLFDKLTHAQWSQDYPLNGSVILDGFAGTGAFGLEALSRGASFAIFFEKDRDAFNVLKRNVKQCSMEQESALFCKDITRSNLSNLPRKPSIVFLDPPYNQNLIQPTLKRLFETKAYSQNLLIILETHRKEPLPKNNLRIEVNDHVVPDLQLLCLDGIYTKTTRVSFWRISV